MSAHHTTNHDHPSHLIPVNISKKIPRENKQWRRDLSKADLERLWNTAQPIGMAGVCMITLSRDLMTLNISHMVGSEKRQEDCELRKIAYIFGLPPGGFNIHSSRNLITLRGDLHVILDQGGFAMLPDLSLMNKIEAIFKDARDDAARTGSHLEFLDWKKYAWLQDYHEYHIIPMGSLGIEMVIQRGSGEVYWSLSELPKIQSWVHPLISIWHAGAQLEKLSGSTTGLQDMLLHLSLDDFAGAKVENPSATGLQDMFLQLLSLDDFARLQSAFRIWRIWKFIPLPEDYELKDIDEDNRHSPRKTVDGDENLHTTRSSVPKKEAQQDASVPNDGDNNTGSDSRGGKDTATSSAKGKGEASQATVVISRKRKQSDDQVGAGRTTSKRRVTAPKDQEGARVKGSAVTGVSEDVTGGSSS